MGIIIDRSEFNTDILRRSTIPIILCSFPQKIQLQIEMDGYVPLNANILLAKGLLKYPKKTRALKAHDEIVSIVRNISKPVFFREYEILFDPDYQINIIRLFSTIARTQRLVAQWPGQLKDGYLEYAEPGCLDYQRFKVVDYEVLCVS